VHLIPQFYFKGPSGFGAELSQRENPQEALLKQIWLNFLLEESGATAIEYGLIAAGIALAIIAVVNGIGTNLNTQFTAINTSLK
jgi:pilus assembly protein Flp/PilA